MLDGAEPNIELIYELMYRSLMLVSALAPEFG
jgi:fumarate hydratase class II